VLRIASRFIDFLISRSKETFSLPTFRAECRKSYSQSAWAPLISRAFGRSNYKSSYRLNIFQY